MIIVLARLTLVYCATPSGVRLLPNWDPRTNFNGDGVVNAETRFHKRKLWRLRRSAAHRANHHSHRDEHFYCYNFSDPNANRDLHRNTHTD